MRSRIAVWLMLVFFLPGCALWPWKKKRAPVSSTDQPRLIGTIAFVNEQMSFVLVDVGSLYNPSDGAALKSFAGRQETAVLAVSPEHKRPFITADIIKGTPHRGDQVYE